MAKNRNAQAAIEDLARVITVILKDFTWECPMEDEHGIVQEVYKAEPLALLQRRRVAHWFASQIAAAVGEEA
jgi:hypothetical protein